MLPHHSPHDAQSPALQGVAPSPPWVVVSGTSLPIFSAALCPRSVWSTRLPSHGLIGVQGSPLTSIVQLVGGQSRHLSPRRRPWCPFCGLGPLPSRVSTLRGRQSSLLIHRPTFSVLWTSSTSGVVVGGSRLASAPPNLRLWSSVLSAAAQIVLCILGASLSLWCHNTDTSVSLSLPLSLGVLTLTWSALVVIASSTKLAPGVVAKVCPSPSPRLSSSRTSFPVRLLVLSSSAMTPRHFSNSTSHSVAGAVISLGGPVLLLSQQSTGSWVSPMHSALPSDVHSRCLVACVPWTTPPLALQTLPVSSGSLPSCKAHGRTGARPLFVPFQSHILATLAFLWAPPPSAIRRWLSREVIPRLDRDLRLRLAAMASDLHGVRVDVSSDNFLPARENPVHSFNLPSSAVRPWGLARWGHDLSSSGRPFRHQLGPSTCPFCHDVDGSFEHHLASCPAHINARAAWAHSCGVSPPDVPMLARHGWVFNPLDELNTPQTVRAHIRFVGLVCESLRPPSW